MLLDVFFGSGSFFLMLFKLVVSIKEYVRYGLVVELIECNFIWVEEVLLGLYIGIWISVEWLLWF